MDWSREKRSFWTVVRAWARKQPSLSAASRTLGLSRTHLRIWLHERDRGLRPHTAKRLALYFGVPAEVVHEKHEAVAKVLRRLRQQVAA